MQTPEFTFDHPSGLRISRDLRESDVASLDGVGRRDMGTGHVWYSVPSVASESNEIVMSLRFRSGLLDSISIAASDADLGSSWSDWSEEKERTRAKQRQQGNIRDPKPGHQADQLPCLRRGQLPYLR